MKKLLFFTLIVIAFTSCRNSGNGELIGVENRERFYQPDPFGMTYVPMGSYTMGTGDQDIAYAHLNNPRTITVTAFWMDNTEITNNEYRQFVYWVRDSIARRILGDVNAEEFLISGDDKTGETYDPPFLNWETELEWDNQENAEALDQMYLPEHERYFRKKEIDTRKLLYEYYFVDLLAASKKDYSQTNDPRNASFANRPHGMKDRSVYARVS